MSTEDPTVLLDAFNDTFKDFQQCLDSTLLAKPLNETLAAEESELEKATAQVTLAYVVYDLIWIYLRTKGIDPMQHPVINELVRCSHLAVCVSSLCIGPNQAILCKDQESRRARSTYTATYASFQRELSGANLPQRHDGRQERRYSLHQGCYIIWSFPACTSYCSDTTCASLRS
jgi:hypothetical protein